MRLVTNRRTFLLGAFAAATQACQHGAPAVALGPFVATGEVIYRLGNASFDANRVVAPRANLTRRSDSSWGGLLMNQPIDASVTTDRLTGVNLMMNWTLGPEGIVITGQWQGRILRFEVNRSVALVRTNTLSVTLPRNDAHSFGPDGQLRLLGEAGLVHPPMPQFGLAMIAAF